MLEPFEKGMGWVPQSDDDNDKIYVPAPDSPVNETVRVDLRSTFQSLQKEPYDQGQLASCTANVVAAALRFGKNAEGWTRNNDDADFNPSRMFIYFHERLLSAADHKSVSPEEVKAFLTTDKPTMVTNSGDEIERSLVEAKLKVDRGAVIRDGMKCLQIYGVCKEETWPYMSPTDQTGYESYVKSSDFYQPCEGSSEEGLQHIDPALTYWRIRDNGDTGDPAPSLISDMEAALTEGYPVAFGILLPSVHALKPSGTLEHQGLTAKFVYNHWSEDGDIFRHHALLAVGYNRGSCLFTILNSWGLGFGDKGYFYLPYRWFAPETSRIKGSGGQTYLRTDDVWVIKSIRRID